MAMPMTDPVVDYVVVARASAAPTSAALAGIASGLKGTGPIVVCRTIAEGTRVPAPSGDLDGGRPVHETWAASLGWLQAAVEDGLDDAAAARVIVRVPWPVSASAEMTLLVARLSLPALRLAVEIDALEAEAVFHYMNRLGQRWAALPAPAVSDAGYAMALGILARLWLFDPRARTPMEPVIDAMAATLGPRLSHRHRAWCYRVTDVESGRTSPPAPWTPSVHTALRAGAAAAEVRRLGAIDAAWLDGLRRLCASIDADALGQAAVAR
jgi:hypothetical protein